MEGSTTAREINRFVVLAVALVGIGKEALTSGFAPVVVAKTEPLFKPTMRTLSFVRPMIGVPAVMGAWLTAVMTSPLSVER